MRLDGQLAPIDRGLVAKLDKVLPANWSRANPIDIIGDAGPERYKATLDAVLAAPHADGILVLNCPTALASSTDAAQAVLDAIHQAPDPQELPPILTNWLGEKAAAGGRAEVPRGAYPDLRSPTDAIKGFFYLWQHTKAQEALMRTPPKETGRTPIADEAARTIMRSAARAGRSMLTEPEAKAVLSAFGIPTVPTRVAASVEEVPELAPLCSNRPQSVVVKILSDDISHKSDVGGVRLGLRTPERSAPCRRAHADAHPRVRCPRPGIQGFTLQPMVDAQAAHESADGRLRGQAVRADDPVRRGRHGDGDHRTIRPWPCRRSISSSRTTSWRKRASTSCSRAIATGRPRTSTVIAEALVHLSQLVVDCPAVKELDINPLLADELGVIALDARIHIDPKEVEKDGPNPRLAIRPYPNQWERWTETADGERILIRPIKPVDEHLYGDFIAKLSPEDIRFRFLAPRKEFSHKFIARFTQIDYARAMAFVALNKDETELLGVARLSADPDYSLGEYAIIVRSDLKGAGIGWILMRHLIHYAEKEGLRVLNGDVLVGNERMLEMCRSLGFEIAANPEDVSLRKVRLKLPARLQDAA